MPDLENVLIDSGWRCSQHLIDLTHEISFAVTLKIIFLDAPHVVENLKLFLQLLDGDVLLLYLLVLLLERLIDLLKHRLVFLFQFLIDFDLFLKLIFDLLNIT